MSRIDLKVGYLCNNQCVHCAIHDARQQLIEDGIDTELTTEQVKLLIDQFTGQYDDITLTGGEISIRNDFIELVQYASQRFRFVEIQTNCRKLATPKNLQALSNLNNIFYTVAIHGNTSDVHDAVTQRRHSFDQTVNGIKQLAALPNHPTITAKFVLTNLNKHCICQTVELAHQLGCTKMDIAFVHGCTDDEQLLRKLLPTYDEVTAPIAKALAYSRSVGLRLSLETFPLCTLDPDDYYAVDELLLSSFDSYVLPVNDRLYDWNKDRIHDNKMKNNQCTSCYLRNNCEGPWSEYWDIHNGQGLTPILPSKQPLRHIDGNQPAKLAGYVKIFQEYY